MKICIYKKYILKVSAVIDRTYHCVLSFINDRGEFEVCIAEEVVTLDEFIDNINLELHDASECVPDDVIEAFKTYLMGEFKYPMEIYNVGRTVTEYKNSELGGWAGDPKWDNFIAGISKSVRCKLLSIIFDEDYGV